MHYFCVVLKNFKLDALGMGTSIICAIHCVTVPFILSFAASAGLNFLHSNWFEFGILFLAVLFVFASLVPSYKKHKNIFPLIAAIIGLALVFINHWVWGHDFYVLSFIGALVITTAHYRNYRLLKVAP